MKTRQITRVALCTALMAVFSQIIIPLPFTPIPFSCGIISLMLCGALLPPRAALLSQLLYVLLGLAGVPVFSGFGAGPAKVLGPTGGYLLGYILAAFLISFMLMRLGTKSYPRLVLAMCCGMAVCYLFGTLWLQYSTGRTFLEALAMGVLPFAPFDLGKILLSAALTLALQKPLARLQRE